MKRAGFLSLIPLAACSQQNDDPITLGPLHIGQPIGETFGALGNGTRAIAQSTLERRFNYRVYHSGSGSLLVGYAGDILTSVDAYQKPWAFSFFTIDPRERIAIAKLDIAKLPWLGSPVFSNVVRPTPSGWLRVDHDDGYVFLRNSPAAAASMESTPYLGLHFSMGRGAH